VIISTIWEMWKIVAILITVFETVAFSGAKAGTSIAGGLAYKATFREFVTMVAKVGAKKALGAAMIFIGASSIMTFLMVSKIFPMVPLACAINNMDVGFDDVNAKATAEELYSVMGSRSIDCWDMFIRGGWDPLWGVDPPNPRTCFLIEAHIKPPAIHINGTPDYPTLSTVYDEMKHTFRKNWGFGDNKIFAYCEGTPMGTIPTEWVGADCTIKDSFVYIMYFDKHEMDFLSYGSAACDMKDDMNIIPGSEVFDQKSDVLVWCVEKMVTN
jgi:hypothetical protein